MDKIQAQFLVFKVFKIVLYINRVIVFIMKKKLL